MATTHKKLLVNLRLQNAIFVILLLVFVLLLGFLALETREQWDISQNGRNSLSQASIETLQKLQGPVQVTAYATQQHAQLGDIRRIISEFVVLYQRIKPDLTLDFVDPTEQPQLAQEAGVQLNGELVVQFNQRREHLTTINEQAFTNALMRLARADERLMMTLSGHGERKLDGMANYDLGEFGQQLIANGFNSQALNLAIVQNIPTNTSMLVIASPQTDLLAGEVDKLLEYVDRGGNLLWLVDQESLRGLLPLTEKLRLTLTPGVVVDPQAEALKAPITFALSANYGQHVVTNNFDIITVFPFARQITLNENEEWRGVSLVDVAPQGWVETGALDEDEITYDQAEDVAGPVSIAVALTRTMNDREQRVVVVGSGHFLANAYLGNGGNLDFGINLINWLAGDEALITIQPRATVDNQLLLSKTALTTIVICFLIVLPVVFLVSGFVIRWRRLRRKV